MTHVLPGVICAALTALFLPSQIVNAQDNCVTPREAADALDRQHGEALRFRADGVAGETYEVYLTPDASTGSVFVFVNGCAVGFYALENWQSVVGGDGA